MHKAFLLFFAFFGVLLFGFGSTVHASCLPMSVEDYRNNADLIVLGHAGKSVEQNHASVFFVEESFKGTVNSSRILVRGGSSDVVTSIDFEIKEGERYLLFLQQEEDSNIFTTNGCSGSRRVTGDMTKEELAVLGQGTSVVAETSPSAQLPNCASDIFSTCDLAFLFLLALLVIWELIWKGLALWRAAQKKDKPWFILLLVLNTIGILPILYLYVFSKKPKRRTATKKSS